MGEADIPEGFSSSEGTIREKYNIPIDQFRQPTQLDSSGLQMRKYTSGERVTRENFIPMYIQSFATSRGETSAQWAYLEWLGTNTGFDYEQTLRNFSEAGAWDCLLPAERQEFTNAFNKIERHYKPATEESVEEMLRTEIREDLDELLDSSKRADYKRDFSGLEGISRSQLTQKIDTFVQAAKVKRKIERYDL